MIILIIKNYVLFNNYKNVSQIAAARHSAAIDSFDDFLVSSKYKKKQNMRLADRRLKVGQWAINVMAAVFWDAFGTIHIDNFQKGGRINDKQQPKTLWLNLMKCATHCTLIRHTSRI